MQQSPFFSIKNFKNRKAKVEFSLNFKNFKNRQKVTIRGPDRFPGIVGNAGNHGNDGKFHESHKVLNQI